jgi:sirohydrochlorin cobaltochelatase
MKRLLLCVAHGSRDPRWRQPFETLFEGLAAQRTETAESTAIVLAYMEMASPTPEEALAAYLNTPNVEAELRAIDIFPLFMAAGAHVANELTELKETLMQRYPQVTVQLLPPFGERPEAQASLTQLILALAA